MAQNKHSFLWSWGGEGKAKNGAEGGDVEEEENKSHPSLSLGAAEITLNPPYRVTTGFFLEPPPSTVVGAQIKVYVVCLLPPGL